MLPFPLLPGNQSREGTAEHLKGLLRADPLMNYSSGAFTERGTRTWSVTTAGATEDWPTLMGTARDVDVGDGMAGREWRSGVGQERPVGVTVASIGSASPKTHLYLAPNGKSGSVLIVSWTCINRIEKKCVVIIVTSHTFGWEPRLISNWRLDIYYNKREQRGGRCLRSQLRQQRIFEGGGGKGEQP